MTHMHPRERVEHLLGVDPASKPAIYLRMFDASSVISTNYTLELLLSAGIATFGLVLDSPAVVIGGMLISPLMGPILAAGLALAAADLYLGLKSLLSIAFGVVISVLFAAGIVWALPFQSATHEVLARTNPNLLDLGVALLSGIAGAVVVCRNGGAGGVTALPGVAIAVALMPPLCALGFGMGSGFSRDVIYGSGLLFLTNLAAIIASAFLVFYLVRMDTPAIRSAIDQSIRDQSSHERLYRMSRKMGLSSAFADAGKLRWRIVMLVGVLAILFVPLSKALIQVRDETIARAAVGEALRMLTSNGAAVSQEVDPLSNPIVIRLIVTSTIPAETLTQAERLILRRTGKDVSLSVRKVASDEELALLRERLTTRQPAPIRDLNTIRSELMARLDGPLKNVWPGDSAPLEGYELGFDSGGTIVRVRYTAEKPLDQTSEQILANALKSRLNVEPFRLVLEYQRATPVARSGKSK